MKNKIKNYKEELIKRYIYLYENATFILAPFMHQQTPKELEEFQKEQMEIFGKVTITEPLIYLKELDSTTLILIEEMLLSDILLEETKGYQLFESLKKDKEYLEKVKIGIEILNKENQERSKILEAFKIKLNLWKLLSEVRTNINEQSGDLNNKEKKLIVLDEYFRINRYENNGKVRKSGYNLWTCDMEPNYSYSGIIDLEKHIPSRDKQDVGVKNNNFINYLSKMMSEENNFSHFTEEEKQQVYLRFHDELPWDLEITCRMEDEYIPVLIETRLIRPENTNPCDRQFNIKEEEIFINPNDSLYRYYQICPHCGYIVNIPKEILSVGIKNRIEERCSKDENLFRKMYLYSELFALDNLSKEGQRRILKK